MRRPLWSCCLFFSFVMLSMVSVSLAADNPHKTISTFPLKWYKYRYIKNVFQTKDGSRLFVGDSNRKFEVWDTKTKKKVGAFKMRGWVRSHAFSATDGTLAARFGYMSTKIAMWDKSGKPHKPIVLRYVRSRDMLFLDSKTLMLATRKGILAIDRTGKTLYTLLSGTSVHALALSSDGKTLVAVGASIALIDLKTRKTTATLEGSLGTKKVVLSADGSRIALAGKGGALSVYARIKGKWQPPKGLVGHTKEAVTLAFISNRWLVCYDKDEKLVVWDTKEGAPVAATSHSWRESFSHIAGGRFYHGNKSKLRVVDLTPPANAKVLKPDAVTFSPGRAKLVDLAWLPEMAPGVLSAQTTYRMVVGDKAGRVFAVVFAPQDKVMFSFNKLFSIRGRMSDVDANQKGDMVAAVAGRKEVKMWRAATKRTTSLSLPFKASYITFAENGAVLWVASKKGKLVALSTKTGKPLRVISSHQSIAGLYRGGKNGEWLMVNGGYSGKVAVIYQSKTASMVRYHKQFANLIGAAYEPSGRWALSGVNGGALHIWDVQAGKRHLKIWTRTTGGPSLDPLRRFAAMPMSDGSLVFYSLQDGKKVASKRGLWSKLNATFVARDGSVVAGLLGSTVMLFTTPALKVKPLDGTPLALKPSKKVLPLSPVTQMKRDDLKRLVIVGKTKKYAILSGYDSQLASVSLPGLKVRTLRSRKFWSRAYAIAPSTDGVSFYAAMKSGGLTRYHTEAWKQHDLSNFPKRITALAAGPKDRLFAVGEYRKGLFLYVRQADGSYKAQLLESNRRNVTSVAFHPNGKWMASGNENYSVALWDLKTKKKLWEVKRRDDIAAIAFHPAGTEIATLDEDSFLTIYDMKGKKLFEKAFGNSLLDGISMAYRADGRMLAVGFERGVLGLVDRKTNKIVRPRGLWQNVSVLRWAGPTKLFVGYGKRLYMADVAAFVPKMGPIPTVKSVSVVPVVATKKPAATKTPVATKVAVRRPAPRATARPRIAHYTGGRRHLSISRKGKLVAYSSVNRFVLVFSTVSGTLKRSFTSPFSSIRRVRLSESGAFVGISNKARNAICIWNVKTKKKSVIRNLKNVYSFRFVGAFVLVEFPGGKYSLYKH